ncbi:helix-turn-helix domain-containing protein [Candidatus Protofrankia californiensis]|uniref:helix-turn-helix domain-containing protein n=1 Tax=Candidatus Protofrankia californiensis TaxID=1839754 RepID=UPI0010413D77|nr:helix-turn-helix domain-containing protein [Candidatus Protofrankia californiensis]
MTRLLLTTGEVADLLGVSRTTVYDLIRTRQLDSVRIGRSRRIHRDELVAYIGRLQGIDGCEVAA